MVCYWLSLFYCFLFYHLIHFTICEKLWWKTIIEIFIMRTNESLNGILKVTASIFIGLLDGKIELEFYCCAWNIASNLYIFLKIACCSTWTLALKCLQVYFLSIYFLIHFLCVCIWENHFIIQPVAGSVVA